MALAYVPDWDPTIKQKPRQPAPWGAGAAGEPHATSSYSQHYQKWPSSRMASFKPNIQYNPADRMPFNFKSTQQDSFQPPIGHKPIPSFKPQIAYQSVEWQQPITTTYGSTFIHFENPKRTQPCYPTQNREQAATKFTGSSTSQDSYQPIPTGYKPPIPFYPSSVSQVSSNNTQPSNFQTTFQASFQAHPTPQYRKAMKPVAEGFM